MPVMYENNCSAQLLYSRGTWSRHTLIHTPVCISVLWRRSFTWDWCELAGWRSFSLPDWESMGPERIYLLLGGVGKGSWGVYGKINQTSSVLWRYKGLLWACADSEDISGGKNKLVGFSCHRLCVSQTASTYCCYTLTHIYTKDEKLRDKLKIFL